MEINVFGVLSIILIFIFLVITYHLFKALWKIVSAIRSKD